MDFNDILQEAREQWGEIPKSHRVTALSLIVGGTLTIFLKPVKEEREEELPVTVSLPTTLNSLERTLVYADRIMKVASKHPDKEERASFLAAIIVAESQGNPAAKSYRTKKNGTRQVNAVGLGQIIASSGEGIEVKGYEEFPEGCALYQGKCYVNLGTVDDKKVDNRERAYPAIFGEDIIFSQLGRSIEACAADASKEVQGKLKVLAYNSGSGIVCEAVARARKKGTLSWGTISEEFTKPLVRKYLGRSLGTEKEIDNQTQDTQRYVKSVERNVDYFRSYFRQRTFPRS